MISDKANKEQVPYCVYILITYGFPGNTCRTINKFLDRLRIHICRHTHIYMQQQMPCSMYVEQD